MQQRKSTFGRPSGTDGSDYSYRMVVDSRYQQVANGRKRLSLLFIIQALFLFIGVIFSFLPGREQDAPNAVAVSSIAGGFISLIIAELGRRRSQARFLKFYNVASSVAVLLLSASLANHYSLLKDIQDLSFWQTRKFNVKDLHGLLAGLLLYISALLLLQICIIKAIVSLVGYMSPPRKAS